MAITIVASIAGAAASGANITLALADTATDDIIVTWGGFAGGTATVPGVLGPTGFTSVWTVDSAAVDTKIEWLRAGATPPTSVLLAGSGDAADSGAYGAYVLRGVTPTGDPLNVPIRTSIASGAIQSPSIITLTADAAVLALGINDVFDSSPGTVTNFASNVFASANDTDDATAAGAASIIAVAGTVSPAAWTTWGDGAYNTATLALTPASVVAAGSQLLTSLGAG